MDKISEKDIISAINEIDSNPELRKGRASSTYDLIYEGVDYPPKLVISIANRFATGKELSPNDFEGGIGTPAFNLFEQFGFEISSKKISYYEELLKFIEQSKAGDLAVSSYTKRFLGLKVVVSFGKGVVAKIPWISFFKEGMSTNNGIYPVYLYFKNENKIILSYGISEENDSSIEWPIDNLKTINTYFQERNYSKPFRYGNSFVFKVYDLENVLIKTDIDNDLIEILEYYKKIDLPSLKTENTTNYWIFQGNPKIYNVKEALISNSIKTWTVSSHKDKIKKGDKFILWQTGVDAGCYALGEVASEVRMMKEEDEEMKYYFSPTSQIENSRVRIIINHNLTENPILWNTIKDDEVFVNFKGSNQGTNFSATEEEYKSILKMATIKKDFKSFLNQFDKNDITTYFNFLKEVIFRFNLEKGDQRLQFNYRNKGLYFTIGQRYAWILSKNKKGKFGVLSVDKLKEDSGAFDGKITHYFNHFDDFVVNDTERISIFKGFEIELNRTKKSGYRKHNDEDFEKAVFDFAIETSKNKTNVMSMKNSFSLNQILYGPPGTGKTYRLQKEYFDKFTIKETALSRDQYLESLIGELSWWQTISIAVLDLGSAKVNEIHEHEFIRIKEKLSSSKTIRPTIWGQLQSHTVLDCPNVNVAARMEPLFFYKNTETKWTVDNELLEQYYPEAFDILEKSKNFVPDTNKSIKNYEFITFHQSFSYEDFIEGIKPKLDDSDKDVSFEIKDGVFKKLCLKAEADSANDYAIFIDEINRGNVSAIFGELITLIENDKRIGGENEIKVRLPYSKSEFGVPSNLFIIGTMNTADRSVEALDTALRRRFSFTEIMPDSTLLNKIEFNGFTLAEVLEAINERIEVLLDRDHTIGHSYFLKLQSGDVKGLKSVFANNIIPLLQEYFYHDYEKIALILGEGFIKIKENKTVKFANFKNIDSPEIANQFELISSIDNIENAISLLLSN